MEDDVLIFSSTSKSLYSAKREKGQKGRYGRQQKVEAVMELRQARGSVGREDVRELHCSECQ